MNKKDLYVRRNYTARRGGQKKRKNIPLFQLQKKRRKLVPKYAKWGDLSQITGGTHISNAFWLNESNPRQEAHEVERKASTLNKNYRRKQNPHKDRRKYWEKEREEL